ncbi:hypothetical protein AC1031_002588 [Aphanomyces cochlioides]|nr:hypothetical protein AC1031_002571 [Aphanomyces cochlioides]KAG9406248.1 hypothetical protein AC1031_002572 [Aphanomyces cochlioides]KAG9406249.1 hypothetical protein AC1031_002573 [Aphanomyces cochlioides]KAG9406250.1 hypothetical protein AC1031_002574 [Aphanomyces cochlioides]KAG9406251.1 hypothetical protein AC1031_002575 [Aphanomyces cochlioides]
MKTCILSALVAAVVMAEGSADSPTMQSSQEHARRDMAAFRDHRPSHPVYIYAPHFTFHEDPTLRSYVDSTLVDVDRRDLPKLVRMARRQYIRQDKDDKESEDAA